MTEEVEDRKRQIERLVKKYRSEMDMHQSEADVRANYIDRLFDALGWDVYSERGPLTKYRREDYISGAGYVDVGLEIDGHPALLIEAKRFGDLPSSTERSSYDRTTKEKQLFKYARGKKIPYCILTNFERLHVFNADHERLILAFDRPEEYLDRFDELLRLSPEKVKMNSLPAWERQLEIKDIDESFLASLQDWRKRLANAIYRHNLTNPALQTEGKFDFGKLMMVVQRLLDRLILIRYADDKEVLKSYDIVEDMLNSYRRKGGYARPDELIQSLNDYSHRMYMSHNTTLFQPGHICEQVFVPNQELEKIMEEMNNISFRKFTSDILGNTYEAYLGTKLVLKNGEIKSEERRDIRKAGGVYYTPSAIVHYIVDNTLGQLLKELETKHGLRAIEKAKEIKVLDPACGSGSFLIYAYRVLSDFYRRINEKIGEEQKKYLSPDILQSLELISKLPKPLLDYPHYILENQLYGVDIDPEAAELTAVNLTMQAFTDAREEKLPLILNKNIKVGNSLISGTEEELRRYFGDRWREKKPFNWEEEFRDVMAQGGFDVVIGNPPYGAEFDKADRAYIEDHYPHSRDNKNSAMVFIEKGLSLIKEGGLFSFIIPKSLAFSQKWANARKLILDRLGVACDVSKAFKEVLLEQMIIVVSQKFSHQPYYKAVSFDKKRRGEQVSIPKETSMATGSIPMGINEKELKIFHKLTQSKLFMSDISKTSRGLPFQKYVTKDPNGIPVYRGDHIARYTLHKSVETLPEAVLERADKKVSFLNQPKILSQQIIAHVLHPYDHIILMSTFDKDGVLTLDTVQNTVLTDNRFAYAFITGLLNSKLWSWYAYRFIFSKAIRTMHFDEYYLGKFPLPLFDSEKHDSLVALVERMLELNNRLAPIRNTPSDEREKLLQEIAQTDREIDTLVYDLYGLTEEERKIVEGS